MEKKRSTPGSHRVYRERNYAFGQQLLTLRTRAALTQGELAEQIGVHRRSLQKWEGGESYPKAETLQRLLAIFLVRGVFTSGQELEEATQLWRLVDQDAPQRLTAFDSAWFARLLAERLSTSTLAREHGGTLAHASAQPAGQRSVVEWGEAIAVPTLHGRERELRTLRHWLMDEHCRVVVILGLGGIGKTSLAITLAQQVLAQFEVVLFRSLRNGPPLAEVLDQAIRTISDQRAPPPEQLGDKLTGLVQMLRERRCLLILDNLESIMQPDASAGTYRTGYGEYGELLRVLGERDHRSCLLLTSRERPAELGPLAGRSTPVHMLTLSGLDDQACQHILEAREITGAPTTLHALARLYGGNPLALQLISEPIHELFGGDVGAFLAAGDAFFNGVGKLLAQQFARATPLEQTILYWLAIGREPVSLTALLAWMSHAAPQRAVLVALESLRRRMLIEHTAGQPAFLLQPVILEFLTDQLVEAVRRELNEGDPQLLRSHALVQATAKDYVRYSQELLIIRPLIEPVVGVPGHAETLERQLLMLLTFWREQPRSEQGYGPGNVVNLLRSLRGELRGLDLTRLVIRQAYLAEVEAQDARLSDAELADTVLAEAFHFPGSVALSSDGTLVVAGTSDGHIGLWRVADRAPLWAVQGHKGGVWSVAFSADGRLVASGGLDGTAQLWEAGTGRQLTTLRSHPGGVWLVALSADGRLLASGGTDGAVLLWELTSGRLLTTLQVHSGGSWHVALSADGQLLASGGDDGTVQLWEASSGELLATLSGHAGVVWGVALSADGRLLASGGDDGTVRLWETGTGQLLTTLQAHTGAVWHVALSADGRLLASGGGDGTVRLWEASSGRPLATLSGPTGAVRVVALSADGRLAASGNFDGTVRLWEAGSGRLVRTLQGHTGVVYSVALSVAGNLLASGSFSGSLRLWELGSGRLLTTMQAHTGAVWGVALSADGRLLASGGDDGMAKLWEVGSGRLLAVLAGHTGAIRDVALSGDSRLLATCGTDGTVRLWEVASGKPLATLAGHTGAIRVVALSADGRIVASGGDDRIMRVWETASGKPLATLSGHSGLVWGVALSADGRLLASSSLDETVRLWEVDSGRQLATLVGHTSVVWSVALSADGRLVVSGGDDGTVRVWEVASGTCLHTLRTERRYERMDITGLTGLSEAQRRLLLALGAVERPVDRTPVPAPLRATEPLAHAGPERASNLPSVATSFVGRSAELAELARILGEPGCRLLTLLGPGGIGKTRLALELAATQRTFADGIAFVALASVSTADQIVPTICHALGLAVAGHDDPTANLLAYLRERHMLLVLDNFEHLLAGADLLSAMLERAPRLTLLATSRERLSLQAEWLFEVDGLALPPAEAHGSVVPQVLAELIDYSAIQLFTQRALQVRPGLSLSAEDLAAIVRICQHVAGMPLAIELAAAGARTQSLATIERNLRTSLDTLATSLHDIPQRHRTMRAVFDHSWNLLSEAERAAFSRVAVFRGGWTIEAAEQVAGITPAVLAALSDKSLVRRDRATPRLAGDRGVPDAEPEQRFVLLEPLREYALRQLAARGEMAALQRAHASYYLGLAETTAAQWDSPTSDRVIAQLDREYDNIRAVLQWARDGGDRTIGLQLGGALRKFWQRRGYFSEGRAWLEELLANDDSSDAAAAAARISGLHTAAWLASDQHDYARATELFEQHMALRRALGEGDGETQPLSIAARHARVTGQYRQATALLEELLSRQRAEGDRGSLSTYGLGNTLYILALLFREQGKYAQAGALIEECLQLHQELGEREGVAVGLLGLSDIARDQGDVALMRAYCEQSLAISRELGLQWAVGFGLHNLALGAYLERDLAGASALVEASLSIFDELQANASRAEVLITRAIIVLAQGNRAAAYMALTESLQLASALGPRLMIVAALEGIASLAHVQGQAELAVRILATMAVLRAQMGTPLRPVDQAAVAQALATARSTLGGDAFVAVWSEAQRQPLEQMLRTIASVTAFATLGEQVRS